MLTYRQLSKILNGIPGFFKKILNTRDSFFLILESQMSPYVMYGGARCKCVLKLSRGEVLHMYVGAPKYTMLVFRFYSLCMLWQYKKNTWQLYMYITLYYNYIYLSLQYHKYICKYTLICIFSYTSYYSEFPLLLVSKLILADVVLSWLSLLPNCLLTI